MVLKKKLYGFQLNHGTALIDVGGGYGELSFELEKSGCNVKIFLEPDSEKFNIAKQRLDVSTVCMECGIDAPEFFDALDYFNDVTIIMQDVIEHIPIQYQKEFFKKLRLSGRNVTFIGRTPNLKSPFGLRNSFGDNTHIYRFTDSSLKSFLSEMGFQNILIKSEPYKVTGLVSLVRSIPYYAVISLCSFSFLAVFGSFEGWMAPNLTFKAE